MDWKSDFPKCLERLDAPMFGPVCKKCIPVLRLCPCCAQSRYPYPRPGYKRIQEAFWRFEQNAANRRNWNGDDMVTSYEETLWMTDRGVERPPLVLEHQDPPSSWSDDSSNPDNWDDGQWQDWEEYVYRPPDENPFSPRL